MLYKNFVLTNYIVTILCWLVFYNITLFLYGWPSILTQYDQLEQYVPRYLVYCLVWAFSGDAKMKSRYDLGDFIRSVTTIPLPSPSSPVLDYEVRQLMNIFMT